MKNVLVVLAVICGAVLLIALPTGKIDATQIAGLGIIFAALAVVAPA